MDATGIFFGLEFFEFLMQRIAIDAQVRRRP